MTEAHGIAANLIKRAGAAPALKSMDEARAWVRQAWPDWQDWIGNVMLDNIAEHVFRMRAKHAFQAIQDGPSGQSILDTFTVTAKRDADAAYAAAEALCDQARALPHHPAAWVKEIGAAQ